MEGEDVGDVIPKDTCSCLTPCFTIHADKYTTDHGDSSDRMFISPACWVHSVILEGRIKAMRLKIGLINNIQAVGAA